MSDRVSCRAMQPGAGAAVAGLVLSSFDEFIGPDCTAEGMYGVPAGEKLGFRRTGPERGVNGVVFIPPAMQLAADL